MDIIDPVQTPPDHEQDLFTNMAPVLVQANAGKRLLNLIIDRVAFYAFLYVIGLIWGLVSPGTIGVLEDIAANRIVDMLLTMLLFAIYMGAQEAMFKGKSLGKFITGTRAVYNDGGTINTSTAFTRGISRIVPLEPFSALGTPTYPWHDKWTDTIVIDEKQSRYFGNETQY
ncbi:MAG: RDD family protein [Chitinophagaceae bacterium]|nr:MAG: RDD family protein [Chitinophagaceae bacterium]